MSLLVLGSPEQLIMWCEKNLALDIDMRGWQVANEVFLEQGKYTLNILKRFQSLDCFSGRGLCSFKFMGDQHYDEAPSRGEAQDEEGVVWFGGQHVPCKNKVLVLVALNLFSILLQPYER